MTFDTTGLRDLAILLAVIGGVMMLMLGYNPLTEFRWYRQWRGGGWATVTGSFYGRRWIVVDWNDAEEIAGVPLRVYDVETGLVPFQRQDITWSAANTAMCNLLHRGQR